MPSGASLQKLKIEGFRKPDYTGSIGPPMEVMINPEKYSRSYSIDYSNSEELGSVGNTAVFKGMGPSSIKLQLIFDGTGIIPWNKSLYSNVDDYLAKFEELVYAYNGDIHSSNFLKLNWGNLSFKGRLKTYQVNYTLFKPDGTTLRAESDVEFTNSTDADTKNLESGTNSPDLTHVRTVRAGDTLPLMSYRIYGDASYYLEVARINSLVSFRDIAPGDQLIFPPLK